MSILKGHRKPGGNLGGLLRQGRLKKKLEISEIRFELLKKEIRGVKNGRTVHYSKIQAWETGWRFPPLETLRGLSEIIDIPLYDLQLAYILDQVAMALSRARGDMQLPDVVTTNSAAE